MCFFFTHIHNFLTIVTASVIPVAAMYNRFTTAQSLNQGAIESGISAGYGNDGDHDYSYGYLNPSISNYMNQLSAFANYATYGRYYGYNNNYYNNGYNNNYYYRQRPRRLTPAEKYQLRSQILAAKKQYEENLQAYYLDKRTRRLDQAEEMARIREREEMLRQQGILPPKKPSKIIVEGTEYSSYDEFKTSPEAEDVLAAWHQRRK